MKTLLIKSNEWFDSLTGIKELYKLLFVLSFTIPLFFGCIFTFVTISFIFVLWRMSPTYFYLYDIFKKQRNDNFEKLVIEKLGQLERGELDNNFEAKEMALKMKNNPECLKIYKKWKRINNE